jgi:Rrf2 family protein
MLSMKAKYALRALIVLGKSHGKMLQIKTIAKDADAPQKFLETILLDLKNQGFVASKRGIFGGYYLSKKPEEIMVGNIIRVIDGPLAPIRCASITAYQKCDDCTDENTCEIRKVMQEVRHAIAGVLDKRSLSDLMRMSELVND